MMPKNYERREKFLELYHKGFKDSEIAKILDVNESAINQIRWEFGFEPNGRGVMSDEEFIEAVKEGLVTRQIMEKFGVSDSAIYRRAKKLNVILNPTIKPKKIKEKSTSTKKKVNEEEFILLYNKGLTDKELQEELKVCNSTVKTYRYKYKLEANKKRIINDITPNDDEFQVLYGTILGDTYIGEGRYNNGDSWGSFNHCIQQKEWIFKKFEYLNRFCNPPILVNKHDDRFKEPDYQQYYCYIKTNKYLSNIYDLLYKEKVKYINEELFSKIEGLGLATWFMDDGAKSGNSYILCTNSFSLNDIEIIQRVLLNKFEIEITVQASNIIRIRSNSINKFLNLIQPYIIPSMQYKI